MNSLISTTLLADAGLITKIEENFHSLPFWVKAIGGILFISAIIAFRAWGKKQKYALTNKK